MNPTTTTTTTTTFWDAKTCPFHWTTGLGTPCACVEVAPEAARLPCGGLKWGVSAVMAARPSQGLAPAAGEIRRCWKVELSPGYFGGSMWVEGLRYPEGGAEDALARWRASPNFAGHPWEPGLPRLVTALREYTGTGTFARGEEFAPL